MVTLKPHPAAELFPMMTGSDFEELVKDIEANGIENPIVLYRNQILDGRNRYAACQQIGVEPRIVYRNDIKDPYAFVVSQNLVRRQLTPGQHAAIAAEIAEHYAREGKQRRVDAMNHRSASTSFDVDAEPTRATVRAARELGVSSASVDRALEVKRHAPELFEQIKTGAMRVTTAHNAMRVQREWKEGAEDMPPLPPPTPMRQRRKPQSIAQKHADTAAVIDLFGKLRDMIANDDPNLVAERINAREEAQMYAAARDLNGWVSKVRLARADLSRQSVERN